MLGIVLGNVRGKTVRRLGYAVVSVAAAFGLVACGSGSAPKGAPSSAGPVPWAQAKSAAAGGGMAALVKAAEAEGRLNVIALPPTWADYGRILRTFERKYPQIKVTSANPGGSSQDELNAIEKGRGQSSSPDVVDVGNAYALQGAVDGDFASYQVATWNDIPRALKDPGGLWWADYGGYISIGCDPRAIPVPCPTTIKELDNPKLKDKVALNGDPTEANAAFMAVWAAALANGGSASNIQPGIDFFKKLDHEGIFDKTSVTAGTVASGSTPIVLDWDYLQLANAATLKKNGVTWRVADPSDGIVGSYYDQAISSSAPDPAAARLWEEFLYSHETDGGQNLFLRGYARPAEFAAMRSDGSLDQAAAAKLPQVADDNSFDPTQQQVDAAKATVTRNWATAVH